MRRTFSVREQNVIVGFNICPVSSGPAGGEIILLSCLGGINGSLENNALVKEMSFYSGRKLAREVAGLLALL